jgi:rRNA maturation protein Rpf1
VESFLKDKKRVLPCAAKLNGEIKENARRFDRRGEGLIAVIDKAA